MPDVTMTLDELKHLVQDTVKATLRELLTDQVMFRELLDELEDAGMGRLVEEGLADGRADAAEVQGALDALRAAR